MATESSFGWSLRMREWRHNPCLMRPVTAVLLLTVALFSLIVTVLKFPALVLGLVLAPVIARFQWVIEFWYPTAIGKFLHLGIVRIANRRSGNDVNKGFHSRATETRIEIVPGRVFIHALPQFLDNLGYLVVCVPAEKEEVTDTTQTDLGTIHVDPNANAEETSIVAFVVDCGDADAVVKHLSLIQKLHYNNRNIYLQSVLSTHKHHDHTAGNHDILNHPDLKNPVKLVFGAAVENVPACNFPLKNGDKLPLPKAGEVDMNEFVEVEAVATPAHTRGSLTYVLRPKETVTCEATACLFTGDTVFSGGGGVPFEADIDPGQEERAPRMTANAYIKASAAMNAVERCFSEVLYRSTTVGNSRDSLLVFPGHEYTNELLTRQITNTQMESCRWKNFTPATFFETVSQLYISLHRRTLPHSSGKLMTVPSTLNRELSINPQFRSLKQRGVVVTNAINLWHRNFAKQRVRQAPGPAFPQIKPTTFEKSRATENQWNLSVSENINRQVFTTVYSSDLDDIIDALSAGRVDAATAAKRLTDLKSALEKPVIGRRPVPGTLPSSRMVYRGLLGLALLGSSPTAMTRSDSIEMNLPMPIAESSDRIRVSKKRLVAVLYWLGLLDDDDGQMLVAMIHQLWKETNEYSARLTNATNEKEVKREDKTDSDIESLPDVDDEVDLGALKWIIYGIPEQQPRSWFATYCMPCSKDSDEPSPNHPAGKSGMERHGGELVRHDVFTCPLCRDGTGCPALMQREEDVNDTDYPTIQTISSPTHVNSDDDESDDENSAFIEVSPQATLGSMIKEF